MVNVHLFPGNGEGETRKHRVLKRLLHRASYFTADLRAMSGKDFAEEVDTILNIKAATIHLTGYPALPKRRMTAELEAWENEGGSLNQAAAATQTTVMEDT